jgi:hypothetical protein
MKKYFFEGVEKCLLAWYNKRNDRRFIMSTVVKHKVKNKYKIQPNDFENFVVIDRKQLKEPLFWRNNVVSAWCISVDTIKNLADEEYGTYNSFWLGIFDEDAEENAGKVCMNFSAYGGMCSYNFDRFFEEDGIENPIDLEIQEKAMAVLNNLLDKKIIKLIRKTT